MEELQKKCVNCSAKQLKTMRRKLYVQVSVLLGFVAALFACTKHDLPPLREHTSHYYSVGQARAFFESLTPASRSADEQSGILSPLGISLDWDEAFTSIII